jgi:deoxycytidine triphosphate deaminase
MDALATELSRSLNLRLDFLQQYLREVRGDLGAGRQGVRDALALAEFYPGWIEDFAAKQWALAPTSVERVDTLRALLTLVRRRSTFIERWFSSARSQRVPLSLIRAVERGCEELGLGRRKPVIAVGPPGNYETFVADWKSYLFSGISPSPPMPREIPRDLQKSRFVVMLIPRFEGGEALWRPVVLGHELAHLRIRAKGVMDKFDVVGKIDWQRLADVPLPKFKMVLGVTPLLALERIARNWAEELLCDAYAARRFGPAGVASLCEFLDVVGATDLVSDSHPPGWLRARLLTGWVKGPTSARFSRVLEPWVQLAASARPAFDLWASVLVDELERISVDFSRAVDSWPAAYDAEVRTKSVEQAADALQQGLPASAPFRGDPKRYPYVQDAINAGWVARSEATDKPIDTLVAKALDDIEFVRLWRAASGEFAKVPKGRTQVTSTGILSADEIGRRLRSRGKDRLVITPLLSPALGAAAVDLRLGAHFITFRRSSTPSFDPLSVVDDPRTMQEDSEKEWGEAFVLHPAELVLASTLEYVALPADLAAQVITRSSYGRLGLITATAIQVHPHFRGCLTLELLNLGEVPVELTPGERIAQLVFTKVEPSADPSESKYSYPTKPEFSKVRTDDEATVLRELRNSVRLRYSPQKPNVQ